MHEYTNPYLCGKQVVDVIFNKIQTYKCFDLYHQNDECGRRTVTAIPPYIYGRFFLSGLLTCVNNVTHMHSTQGSLCMIAL